MNTIRNPWRALLIRGVHPNDKGFAQMGERLATRMRPAK